MTKVKIPRSAKGVTDELGQIGELLTATEWKRAALLASIVRLTGSGGNRGSRSVNPGTGVYTPEQFAALGIKGLRKGDTVRLYVQRWLDANDGEYPELGKSVELPEEDWPPTRTGTDGYESEDGARRTIEKIVEKHGPKAVAEAVVDNPSLDTEVSRTRLDRHITPDQRRDLRDRNRGMEERLEDTIRASRAGLADHMQHQAELHVMSARMHLRKGVKELENNPYVSPSQQQELALVLDECEHLISLLRQGVQDWSDNDRSFLAALGVES